MVFISAELEEVLRLSHRVVVLRDRAVVAVLDNEALTADQVMATMAEGVAR
ncbi:simple sugar transport system ATP-binding protein [Amycolatopsis keratiniphila]|nr:simple sugar transport system ATP-binding protein [Amycolatopsis keratiniphila]